MENQGKIMSCCGVVCSDCRYFGEGCSGCPEIAGRVFWLQYTGEPICSIYDCCVRKKKLVHCGLCKELPCSRYEQGDPTMTPEENEAGMKAQLQLLREMAEAQQ